MITFPFTLMNTLSITPEEADTILANLTLRSGLVAYYPLSTEGSVPDRTNRYDGTNNGATYTTAGKIEGAYSFDGSDDYINCSDITQLENIDELTISIWVKLDSTDTNNKGIVGKGTYYNSSSSWALQYNAGASRLNFSVSNSRYRWITNNILDDEWHNIICTYSNISDEMKIYVDGVLQTGGADTGTFITIPSSTHEVWVGKDSFPYYTKGSMAEVGFWNRVLTTDEITTLYNSNTGILYQKLPFNESSTLSQDLISYYPLDGQSCLDIEGTNNATNNGATWSNSGKITSCMGFDGSNDSISCSGGATGNFKSYSFWVKKDDTGNDVMISQGVTSSGAGLYLNNTRLSTYGYDWNFSALISDTDWHHIVVTNSGTTWEIFKDSVSQGTNTLTTNITNDTLYIGSQFGSAEWFDGKICEVSVWDKVLTTSEITALYNSNTGLAYRGLFNNHTTLGDVKEYFSFENDAKSDSGNAVGTVNGATHSTEGILGNCYELDGTNDYIEKTGFFNPGDKTFSFWYKGSGNSGDFFFESRTSGYGQFCVMIDATGVAELTHKPGTGVPWLEGSTVVNDDEWHHILISYQSSNTELKLYVDGDLDNSRTSDNANISQYALCMGTRYTHNTGWLQGKVAEIGYWERVLTTDEISDLYNNGIGRAIR